MGNRSPFKCHVKRCNRPLEFIYYGHNICEKHWGMHCDESRKFDLKDHFDIEDGIGEELVEEELDE